MSKKKSVTAVADEKKNLPLTIGILLLISFIVFSPALSNEFVNWDDFAYIVDNPLIRDLSFKNIAHVFNFQTHVVGNYHPLTVLTYMIEYKFVGLKPMLYHFDNLLLHLLNIVLVAAIVWKLSKHYWTTVIAAALFALHPMHVESVVWAAERKDVLYTLFFLLSIYTYLKYLATEKKQIVFFIACLLFFLLSILSKGQAVVLPMVLVLIDYWYSRGISKKTILEKIPFFALSLFFGLLATQAQASSLTAERLQIFGLTDRIFFAAYNLLAYPFKLIYPFELACFYGYPLKSEMTMYYLALPAILLLLGFIFWKFRKDKVILFGLLFFLFTISIVIQLLPIGNAIIADRYTYVPYIGLFFMIGELINRFIQKNQRAKANVLTAIVIILFVFAIKSYAQSLTWKSSETIWLQVLKVNPKEPIAQNNIGAYYLGKGQTDKALKHLLDGVTNGDNYQELFKMYNNLGSAYKNMNQFDQAVLAYNKAIELQPGFPDAIFGRGLTYTDLKKYDAAIADFTTILKEDPNNANAYYSRGLAHRGKNDIDAAITDYQQAIQTNPNYAQAYTNLGNIYFMQQKLPEAITYYTKSLNIVADGTTYLNRSKANFMSGRKDEALRDYRMAEQNGVTEVGFLGVLEK